MNFQAHHLAALGWSEFFEESFRPYAASGYEAARVALEHRHLYGVYTERGELLAETAGKLRHEAASRDALPAVGDWVVIRARPEGGRATIHAVLPRRSKFTRKAAGERTEEQIVGTNIDTVFLITSLNQDFNLRRIERYLIVAWDSGADPVVVLSKSDLSDEVGNRIAEIREVARGVPVHAVSVVNGEGLGELAQYIRAGQTVALLGSSGVGKSTLINHLAGRDLQRIQEVREHDDRGRHTTTHRELILLPQGGLVLDTPGMRELQLWDGEGGLRLAFDDIEALARDCHFGDCRHQDEPGCAIRDALDSGAIDAERYESYEKLQKELSYLSRKQDKRAQITEKQKWKKLSRLASERSKMKRR
ncbi:MAG TPA: ribosome small subunit-dependent GTPase A [Pyrinomonadaceae bacterium]|nr:ribosome small subunit-dependent GTPase A [Pyrinomonadaceae bacterium]